MQLHGLEQIGLNLTDLVEQVLMIELLLPPVVLIVHRLLLVQLWLVNHVDGGNPIICTVRCRMLLSRVIRSYHWNTKHVIRCEFHFDMIAIRGLQVYVRGIVSMKFISTLNELSKG